MDGLALLNRARATGLDVRAEGERLVVRGPRTAEPMARELLAHKPEIMAHLTGKGQSPKLKYPDRPEASDKELAEIEATVQERGVCLLYSYVLKDYIAFVKDETHLKDVPTGFTPYLDSELRLLFGGTDAPSVAKLKLIHAAKKTAGGKVIGSDNSEGR